MNRLFPGSIVSGWFVGLGVVVVSAIPVRGEPGSFTWNGQPFFPITTYGYPGDYHLDDPSHWAEMSGAGFNSIHKHWLISPTTRVPLWNNLSPEQLEELDRYGLKVVCHVQPYMDQEIDQVTYPGQTFADLWGGWLDKVKDSPALWVYETYDEPLWINVAQPWDRIDLNTGKAFANGRDPNHPVLCNFSDFDSAHAQSPSRMTFANFQLWRSVGNIWGMDSYGVLPGAVDNYPDNWRIEIVIDNCSTLRAIAGMDKPVNMVVQGCAFNEMLHHPTTYVDERPNYVETRFVTYGSIIRGAKGISYFRPTYLEDQPGQMWIDLKRCASELASLEAIWRDGTSNTNFSVPEDCEAICRIHNGEYYLLVANVSKLQKLDASITVNGWPSSALQVVFEGRTKSGPTFQDTFEPWDVHIYKSQYVDTCEWHPPDPKNALANPGTIASGGTAELKASTVYGAEIHWYKTIGWTQVGTGESINVSPTQTTEYQAMACVSGSSPPCYSSAGQAVTVTVASQPLTPPVPTTANYCGFTRLTRAAPPMGETWYWQTTSGGTSVDNALVHWDVTSAGTYYLRARSDAPPNNWSSSASATVTVDSVPVTPTNAMAHPPVVCDGDSTDVTASVPGAVIDWYTGSCGGTLVHIGDVYHIAPTSTTTYYARARNASTNSESPACDDVTVTILSTLPIATVTASPGVGTGTIRVSSNLSGLQEFYLLDEDCEFIDVWTADSTYHDFSGLADGTYRGYIWSHMSGGCCRSDCASAATLTNRPRPDFDSDGDIDQEDFGHFQACLSGSGVIQADPNCQDADLNQDGDVDADDFALFQSCMGGANQPPDC